MIELNKGFEKTKQLHLESPCSSDSSENTTVKATCSRNDKCPCCSFYTCFAYQHGRCTVLNNNDFHGGLCPFYKRRKQAAQDRQDAFDKLLINGRLDLINRYEEILVNLGIEDPEDAKVPIDDDVLAARKELENFEDELASAEAIKATEAEEDDFMWDE